jgi:NAD(P)-dependent dehydrogenase (short-subunit alcohol dehydrogenase family)
LEESYCDESRRHLPALARGRTQDDRAGRRREHRQYLIDCEQLAPANTAAYASSKAGVNALSRSMALELARHKIRVNAVCPGVIDTFRMDDLGRGETWKNFVKTMIPLGYPGDGTECAEMILFLVSDRGKWITGQAINVDGGSAWGN